MVELSSHKQEAVTSATAIASSVEAIRVSSQVEEDNLTTIEGNNLSKNWLSHIQTIANQMGDIVQSMSSNIHGVAAEFEAKDVSLGQALQTPPASAERLVNFNG